MGFPFTLREIVRLGLEAGHAAHRPGIVEEAVASGIEQIILVTSAGKSALENHFD